jgi:hypothetical protein
MAPTARVDDQVKATSRHHNELIPPPLHARKLAQPIPSAGGADVRWRTVRDGTAQSRQGP